VTNHSQASKDETWVLVSQAVSQHERSAISLNATFFSSAVQVPPRRLLADLPRTNGTGRTATVCVNVAGLGHVLWFETGLLVSDQLREALAGMVTARFVPTPVVKAYFYPFELEGDKYIKDEDRRRWKAVDWAEDDEHWILRLAEKYACDIPQTQYYEFVAAQPWEVGIPVETLPHYLNRGRYHSSTQLPCLSRTLLEERGVTWSFGYQFREDVFAVFERYINRPFFDIARIRFDAGFPRPPD
jgi:hypothetical protein